ncbi:MAG: hypothetical protein Q9226_002143 [Calogaya cf. arnoldii]
MPPNECANPPAPPPRQIKLPRHRLRTLSTKFQSLHRPPPQPPPPTKPISVVCISDTHGTQPPIPPGDLLLHAGDLTQWGTFSEIQAQLTWLSAQPHTHKVVIAGNHDLLLDIDFRTTHPERWNDALRAAQPNEEEVVEEHRTEKDLHWGGVVYLQNTSTTLTFGDRTITIYGSPLTPQHGLSAFQHPKNQDVWSSTIPADTDILLTHGPPWGHLDGVKKSGCPFLAREVVRSRPRLVVFGHIHVGYGSEERVLDTVGRAHEGIAGGWAGWGSLVKMVVAVTCGRIVPQRWRRSRRRTTFVNAAVVEGWEQYKQMHTYSTIKELAANQDTTTSCFLVPSSPAAAFGLAFNLTPESGIVTFGPAFALAPTPDTLASGLVSFLAAALTSGNPTVFVASATTIFPPFSSIFLTSTPKMVTPVLHHISPPIIPSIFIHILYKSRTVFAFCIFFL